MSRRTLIGRRKRRSEKFEGRKGDRWLTHGPGSRVFKKKLANRRLRHERITDE